MISQSQRTLINVLGNNFNVNLKTYATSNLILKPWPRFYVTTTKLILRESYFCKETVIFRFIYITSNLSSTNYIRNSRRTIYIGRVVISLFLLCENIELEVEYGLTKVVIVKDVISAESW